MLRRALAALETRAVSHNPGIRKRVMLDPGEIPGLTNFSEAVFEPGDKAPGHAHDDMWEVFFVRSGGGALRIDGRENRLGADECWVIQPGEVHEIENDTDDALRLLYFGVREAGDD